MSLTKGFLSVSGLTLVSRIFGYIRDLCIAFFLGAGPYTDAFFAAFRLPNLFRTIFGEGALNAVFVPMFSKKLNKKNKQEAYSFASSIFVVLLIGLTLLCGLAYMLMPQLVLLLTPGFADNPELLRLTIALSYILFPYIAFASLMAFFGGILNSFKIFWVFAAAPIILNLVTICSMFSTGDQLDKTISLSTATIVAGILETLWCYYYARKAGLRFNFKKINYKELKTFFSKFGPAVLSSSIVQINIFLSTIIASFSVSGISYLYYADRVYQLPLALIGTALGTVLLPYISGSKSKKEGLEHINKATELTLFLIFPSTIILMLMPNEIIALLFERGSFTKVDTLNTSYALAIYAFALPGFVLSKIFFSTFYANGNTKTPFYTSLLSLILNFMIGFSLMDSLGFLSVAIGAVVGSYSNIGTLYLLGKKYNYIDYTSITDSVKRIVAAAMMLFITIISLLYIISDVGNFLKLVIIGGAGKIVYLYMLRSYWKPVLANLIKRS